MNLDLAFETQFHFSDLTQLIKNSLISQNYIHIVWLIDVIRNFIKHLQ